MANRTLTIVAKIKDAASSGLKRIKDSLDKTSGSAKKTTKNFTEFNRVMFATTAYVGFFTRAFNRFGDSLLQGAEFGRVVNQFERVLGPKGDLFSAISGFTDNSIDKVEALRSAIQLKTLGIVQGTSDTAELIARAGTAAKMAGLDSAEGIRKFTSFLKDGSIANLEFLNLIRSSDPALKLQLSLLGKMGGVLGSAMTAQMKYNLGLRLLRTATQGALKGQRDLYDVIFDIRQSFTLLKNEIGLFLGTSLSSLIDKVTRVTDKFTSMLEYIRTNKKEVLFLAKSVAVLGSALAALTAGLGTIRLLSFGLKALGFTAGPIVFAFGALATVFAGLTYKVKEGSTPLLNFVEKLRVFGAVLKGVYELVTSYLTSQDNMRKGIGQIDQDLFELLNKNGLFVFVHRVSQAISILARFGLETFKELVRWAKWLDKIFGSFTNKFSEIFGVNKQVKVDLKATGNVIDEPTIKRLSDYWLSANTKSYRLLIKAAAALALSLGTFKMTRMLQGTPIVGKSLAIIGNIVKTGLTKVLTNLVPKLANLSGIVQKVTSLFRGLSAGEGIGAIYVLMSAFGLLSGVVQGLVENFNSFTGFFGSSYDYIKSLNIGKFLYDKLQQAFGFVAPYIETILSPLEGVFNSFKSWVDIAIASLQGFYKWLSELPVVGKLVKASASAFTNPYDTFKSFGKEAIGAAGAGLDLISDKMRNATAKNLLESARSGNQPSFIPATSEERSDYALRAIQQASGAEQSRMAKAFRESQLGTSAGGKEITPEEWVRIFGFALDNSKVTKHAKETATEVKTSNQKTTVTSRRGGC